MVAMVTMHVPEGDTFVHWRYSNGHEVGTCVTKFPDTVCQCEKYALTWGKK